MSRFARLVVLAAIALASCAPIGGAPGFVAERGIGGTGGPSLADRGIGGTGISDDTVVVGTITGFGSVWIDGLEIGSDAVAEIEVDGARRPSSALRVGQFARVVAWSDDTHLHARMVEVQHEASGPVERIAPGGAFVVAGQRVRITPRTLGDVPRVGDWVEVSGPRNARGGIMATRIDRREPGRVTVSGRLLPTADGRFHIGGVFVRPPANADTRARRVTATGALAGHTLIASGIRPAPLLMLRPGLRRLVVEAFVESQGGGLQLGEGGAAARGSDLGVIPTDAPVVLDLTPGADGRLIVNGFHPNVGGGAGGAPGAGPPGAPAAASAARGAAVNGAASAGAKEGAAASTPSAESAVVGRAGETTGAGGRGGEGHGGGHAGAGGGGMAGGGEGHGGASGGPGGGGPGGGSGGGGPGGGGGSGGGGSGTGGPGGGRR